MKIRNDFVTNSSSASYILGKAEDVQLTAESAYEMVRQVYLDVLSDFRDVVEDNLDVLAAVGVRVKFKNDHSFEIEYNTNNLDREYNARQTLWKVLGNRFDSMTIYSGHNFSWLNCATYAEYLEYFDKNEKKDSTDYAPFAIYDFAEKAGDTWDAWAISDAVDWYGIDIDEGYLGNLLYGGDCQNCHIMCYGRFSEDESDEEAQLDLAKCRQWKKRFENGTAENLLLLRFGKIMIASNHELNMPLPVHKALEKKAAFGCCHMG